MFRRYRLGNRSVVKGFHGGIIIIGGKNTVRQLRVNPQIKDFPWNQRKTIFHDNIYFRCFFFPPPFVALQV